MKKFNSIICIQALASLALLVMLGSCETKNVNLYPTFTQSAEVDVHNTGTYSESGSISVADVRQAIADLEIQEDITDVMIEGVWLEVTKDAVSGYGNTTATSATADLILNDGTGTRYNVLKSLTIDLTKTTQTIYLHNKLNKSGIQKLRTIMLGIAQNTLPSDYNVVAFELEGSTVPANAFINAHVKIFVKVAVEYAQEVPGI